MNAIVFAYPGNELLTHQISMGINCEEGHVIFHQFPDGESLVRVESDVKGKNAIVVATLDYPDSKILSLHFLCRKLKDDGAANLILISPYLPYMRQDKSFHKGEAVTSIYFASLLSSIADQLITIDPHLHRHHSLNEIYPIPCTVLHSVSTISKWIIANVDNPVLIGPDIESKQWVSQVAESIQAPFVILNKERLGDQKVKITFPEIEKYKSNTPVLLDDIISTGRTMIETLNHLKEAKLKPAVCIGVHALFAEGAFEHLINAGAHSVITCNTIPHASNQIDLTSLIIESLSVSPVPKSFASLYTQNDKSHGVL